MTQAAGRTPWFTLRNGALATALTAFAFLLAPGTLHAQTDCLLCHGDKNMTNAAGHNISVNGKTFSASVHGVLQCTSCHTDIKGFPHPDHIAKVQCSTCHADQVSALAGSVHANHACTSCHGKGNPHGIFPKNDPRSAVYPLNIPRTCGSCHGNPELAKKYGLPNVYAEYTDSIHGFAVSNEGLLVAANCQSCHGSHHILSHTNPQSRTYRTNIPDTCGKCHARIEQKYDLGAHGKAIHTGDMKAPVCTDCHTAHTILQPTAAAFRAKTTPLCGSCHKKQYSTYRDTFHSQLGLLGGYVQTARCWDCHEAHEVLPASDPRSAISKANLVKTCGRCHKDANVSFVQYEPHANSHDFEHYPGLYFVRLFMEVLLISVLTFFAIHTILWVIRSRYHQVKNGGNGSAKGGKDA